MIVKAIIIAILFIISGVIGMVAPVGSGNDAPSCVDLLNMKCKSCHSMTRICRNLVKTRSEIWWQSNIENMVAYGAKYTTTEQNAFLKCLLKPYAEIEQLCN